MTDTIRCDSCRTENPLGNKFCRQCGATMSTATWTEAPAVEEEGFVSGGVWRRPPGEFVRRVRQGDQKAGILRAGVEIPQGSVGVLIVDGQVSEVLRPGFRTTASWVDRLTNLVTGKLDRTDVYLVDLRALPIPFAFDATDGGTATKYQVIVELRVRPDPGSLHRLIEQAVGDREGLGAKAFYDQVRSEVAAIVQPRLAVTPADAAQLAAMEREVTTDLARTVGDRYGVDLTARVSPVASTVTLDVRVGGGPVPATKQCVACNHDIESSKPFCTKCGASQPARTQPSRGCGSCGALVAEGKKFCTKCGVAFVERPAASAPIYTSDGHDVELDLVLRLEASGGGDLAGRVTPIVAAAVSKHVRAVAWLTLATAAGFAELERAIKDTLAEALRGLAIAEVTVLDIRSKGAEWQLGARAELEHAMREVEAGREWLKLEAENLDLKTLQLDMLVRSQRIERDNVFALDQDELADRRKRQTLAAEHVTLDVADAKRDATAAVDIDATTRGRDRAIGAETHTDRLTGASRAQELEAQQSGFVRTQQTDQARHERSLAREVTALDAEKARTGTDTAAYATRTRGEAEVAVARSKQDLELDAEVRRQAAQIEKLRFMAELDAKIREDELREQRQAEEHALRMRQELKGLTAEQMLAAQVGSAQGEHIAAALAEKFKADAAATGTSAAKQQELYERMLTEQKAAQAAALAATQQANAQIASVLQTLGAVATAAVGGQREAQAATATAHERATAQATSVAERSVTAMGQALSGGPARVSACANCRAAMAADDRVCGECGTRL